MMKPKLFPLVLTSVLYLFLIAGCGGGDAGGGGGGGGNGLDVGDIAGPGSTEDGVSTEFAIYAGGDTGIGYLWSTNPSNAGQFDNANSAITNFTAASVTADTNIELIVTVNSDKHGPVVSKRTITIREFHGKCLLGTWEFTLYDDDPELAFPPGPMEVTIYQVNASVHATVPVSLFDFVGDPKGFFLSEDGKEARSTVSIWGGGNRCPIYEFEYDEDNNIVRMYLGVRTGICDGLEGVEYQLCTMSPHKKHWYAASYFGPRV